jgi:hypothetical protein
MGLPIAAVEEGLPKQAQLDLKDPELPAQLVSDHLGAQSPGKDLVAEADPEELQMLVLVDQASREIDELVDPFDVIVGVRCFFFKKMLGVKCIVVKVSG